MPKKKQNSGYTLIELLVVIAIIGILAVGVTGVYNGYIQKAFDARRVQKVREISFAVQYVKDAFGEVFPYAPDPYTQINRKFELSVASFGSFLCTNPAFAPDFCLDNILDSADVVVNDEDGECYLYGYFYLPLANRNENFFVAIVSRSDDYGTIIYDGSTGAREAIEANPDVNVNGFGFQEMLANASQNGTAGAGGTGGCAGGKAFGYMDGSGTQWRTMPVPVG